MIVKFDLSKTKSIIDKKLKQIRKIKDSGKSLSGKKLKMIDRSIMNSYPKNSL